MALDDALLSLIENIYDAAIDETLWPATLERLAAIADSQAATFWILDSSTGEPRLPTFTYINLDPRLIKEYLDFMAPHDPTVRYIVTHPDQKVIHDASFITEREKDRHPYYDWHHRYTDMRHRLVGMIHPAPVIHSGVALHRTRAKGDFDPPLLERFAMLFRHIERALQIGFRLGTLGSLQQISLAMLDRNPLAIILLDDKGRVILANRAARDLGKDADGVRLTGEALTLLRQTDDMKLQRLIGEALRTTTDSGARPGGAMSALRPSGKRPFSILVSPLPHNSFIMTTLHPAACVVIADPEKRDLVPADRLRAVYGLTQSEARLAMPLAAGEGLPSAAASLGISYATARTQLAAIFRKTETRRQGELVKLLLTTLPPLSS
jgi:DNA-binding CsgD family transcriptional regulator/PAS domain-containing protein